MRIVKSGLDPKTQKQIIYGSFTVEAVEKASAVAEDVTYLRKAADDEVASEGAGILEGYMSTFNNNDATGDIIRKGAFTKSLKERMPRVLWQHDAHEPIGVFKEIYEDSKGLFARIELNLNVQRGREAYELFKQGAMDSFSIGALLEKYEIVENAQTGRAALDVKELRLYEVSVVTFPANEKATVTAIKEHLEEALEQVAAADLEEVTKADTIEGLIDALVALKAREEQDFVDFIKTLEDEKAAAEQALLDFVAGLTE